MPRYVVSSDVRNVTEAYGRRGLCQVKGCVKSHRQRTMCTGGMYGGGEREAWIFLVPFLRMSHG